jgi:hypothetical protein
VLSPSPAQVDAKENDDHSSNGAGSVEGASDDEDGLGGYYEDDFGPDPLRQRVRVVRTLR